LKIDSGGYRGVELEIAAENDTVILSTRVSQRASQLSDWSHYFFPCPLNKTAVWT